MAHTESYAHAQANQLGTRSETKVIGLELSLFSPGIREGFSFLKKHDSNQHEQTQGLQ